MALDYDGASAGIFTRIGKIIKYINSHAGDVATLVAELKAIADLFETADLTHEIDGLYAEYEAFKQNVVNMRQRLASYADNVLLDQDTVLDELRLTTADLESVLDALITRMNEDGESVLNSTVTIGSVTPAAGNVGDGAILIYNILDGYNSPVAGGLAHVDYAGLTTQMAVSSETMTFTCIVDSSRDGGTEGGESWSWQGMPDWPEYHFQAEGSGDGPVLNVAQETFSIVSNGDFESFSSNTPSGWTVDNGTPGTHILKNSSASFVYRGSYSLNFHGTGAAATIGLSQAIDGMTSGRAYCVAVRIKADSIPAAGTIEIAFAGTGYTPALVTPEVQTFQVSGTPTGGSYTLSWTGPRGGTQTTGAIAYNATSADVEDQLRLLTGLESVVVTTAAGSPPNVTHSITFYGVDGDTSQLTSNISGLTGGTPARAHATTTPGVRGEKVLLPSPAFPETWGLYYFWIQPPVNVPNDWELAIQITGTMTNGCDVYFDDLTIAEVQYHGGIGAVAIAGATPPKHGDRFTVIVSNDDASKIQEFARRHWRVQLPSASSPTISNSLAT